MLHGELDRGEWILDFVGNLLGHLAPGQNPLAAKLVRHVLEADDNATHLPFLNDSSGPCANPEIGPPEVRIRLGFTTSLVLGQPAGQLHGPLTASGYGDTGIEWSVQQRFRTRVCNRDAPLRVHRDNSCSHLFDDCLGATSCSQQFPPCIAEAQHHPIEGREDRPELILPVFGEMDGQVAPTDALGRHLKRLNRPRKGPSHDQRESKREDGSQGNGHPQQIRHIPPPQRGRPRPQGNG